MTDFLYNEEGLVSVILDKICALTPRAQVVSRWLLAAKTHVRYHVRFVMDSTPGI